MSDQRPSDDERVIDYLRSRANVTVPPDLLTTATARPTRSGWARVLGFAGSSAAAAVVLVVGLAVVIGGSVLFAPVSTTPPSSVGQSAAPTATATVTPTSAAGDMIAGLPVITVAQAVDLLQAGKLDGRLAAVRGYLFEMGLPCPAPMGYIGPLEDWCHASYFTDDDLPMYHCAPSGVCSYNEPISVPHLKPFDVIETSRAGIADNSNNAKQVIVIGHGGDPRQWQCTMATQTQCAGAFVMDAILAAGATSIDVVPPGAGVTPRMSLAAVEGAAGIAPDAVINAVAVPADHAVDIDPRLNFATDDTVWIVHSLAAGSNSDPTRSVAVTVIQDATSKVLATLDLSMPAGYQPARLWLQATTPNDCCAGQRPYPFFSIGAHSDRAVHSGMIEGGAWGSPGSTRYGPGAPTLLDAGTYVVGVWLSAIGQTDYYPVASGAPIGACSTTVTLNPLDDVRLQASFPADGACTFGPAPSETPLP